MTHSLRPSTIETPLRHPGTRCFASEFDPADIAIAEAWARITPEIESFHLGRFDDGGACISLTVRDTEALTTWLICPEAGQILVKNLGRQSAQSCHRTLWSALQAVVSPCQVSAILTFQHQVLN
jgi:hypothetical protein